MGCGSETRRPAAVSPRQRCDRNRRGFPWTLNWFHRRDEAIAPARESLDETGSFRRIAERHADLIDGFGEALVEIDEGPLRPDPCLELAPGHDLAGLVQQCRQDLEWLVFQFDPDAALAQFPGLPVDFEHAEPDPAGFNGHFHMEAYHTDLGL